MRLDVIRTCRPTQRALKKENETLARQLDAALDENAKMLRKLHNARLQWQLEAAKRKLVQLHHKRQTLLAEKGQLEGSRNEMANELTEYCVAEFHGH